LENSELCDRAKFQRKTALTIRGHLFPSFGEAIEEGGLLAPSSFGFPI
jgi:hypothetical protein